MPVHRRSPTAASVAASRRARAVRALEVTLQRAQDVVAELSPPASRAAPRNLRAEVIQHFREARRGST